jgi:Na+/proline symporter
MLATVGVTIFIIADSLGIKASNLVAVISDSDYSSMFVWDWRHEHNFFKQFLAGTFISIAMTGLDQDMMQKNLTCKNIKEAQKNMFWFSIVLVFANLMFLSLGALLYMYADAFAVALPVKTDMLFPTLALNHFSPLAGILFILGIIAAAYSSADSALTALTTSFCVDILNFRDQEEAYKKRVRTRVHIGFSVLTFLVIMVFALINDESVINSLFTAAGYTYGPLLGLFSFGMFTKYPVKDRWVPWICLASPLLSYIINIYSVDLFWGYRFGFEILLLNGFLTFVGLLIITGKKA